MRLASWNCCSGGAKKLPELERLAVDVAVICEAPRANPRSAATLLGPAISWHSTGIVPYKSLAIAGITQPLEPIAPRAGQGSLTAAGCLASGLAILGMWSLPDGTGGAAYEAEVLATLDAWGDDLAAGDMIMAGDLNIGHAIGRPTPNSWIARAQALWDDLGMVSAYHEVTGEKIGSETRATHYWRRKQGNPWHIDFVLLHRSKMERVRSVEIGSYDDWVATGLSDHVPVIVDIDW